jgi:hypothetical protein
VQKETANIFVQRVPSHINMYSKTCILEEPAMVVVDVRTWCFMLNGMWRRRANPTLGHIGTG